MKSLSHCRRQASFPYESLKTAINSSSMSALPLYPTVDGLNCGASELAFHTPIVLGSSPWKSRQQSNELPLAFRSVGTEFKVMQELLRHSSLRSTLDVYTQAITPAKHAAQAVVMSLVFATGAQKNVENADNVGLVGLS
ncbi:hypothetical protein [Edaphobacter bradus]|uniref:hypothetical protein n=1 Tax=Edaphobacter bradus TaxID=2259016 RepID=UPI0021DFF89C|nr:hypothetical protein [Edaphobacter bradus]